MSASESMPSSRPSVADLRPVIHPPGLLERTSGEHWAGRLYMRRLSPYATWLAIRLGLSANALTGFMIVIGLVAAVVMAVPALVGAVVGAVLIQAYLLLDCSDGEVARWRRASSVRGVYLDRFGHYVVEAAVIVALGVRASRWDEPAWVILGLTGGLLVLIEKAETDLVDAARHRTGLAPTTEEAATMTKKPLATGRRLADFFPVHRITHAIEASLLVATAAGADAFLDGSPATRGLLLAMVVVSAVIVVLHLVSVLSSRRLVEP